MCTATINYLWVIIFVHSFLLPPTPLPPVLWEITSSHVTSSLSFWIFFVNRILVQFPVANREFYHIMYVQFYCRMAPYLVGIACAQIYMKTNDKVHNSKATWWKVGDGFQINHWFFCIGIMWEKYCDLLWYCLRNWLSVLTFAMYINYVGYIK